MANDLAVYAERYLNNGLKRDLSISARRFQDIALVTNTAVSEATVVRCYALEKVSTTLTQAALIQAAAGGLSYQQKEAVRRETDAYLERMKRLSSSAVAEMALITNKLKR